MVIFPFLVNGNFVRLVDAAEFTMKMMSDDREVVTIRMGKMDIKKGDLVVFVPEQTFVDLDKNGIVLSFHVLRNSILAQATDVFHKPLNKFTLADVRGQDLAATTSAERDL